MKTKLRLFILAMLFSVSLVAQKTDVWDFGGETLDASLYNNMLTSTIINSNFYVYNTVVVPGAANNSNVLTNGGVSGNTNALNLTGGLSFRPNTNDRLYTKDLSGVTRYANENGLPDYTGRIFCNGNASTSVRFFTMALNEDDEVTFVARLDNATANLNIVNTTTNAQTENIPLATSSTVVTKAKFMAKAAGSFKISCFDNATARASYYRVLRKPASYSAVTGTMDETAASGIPAGYSVRFTYPNGKTKDAVVTSSNYSISLPIGYTYKMSLVGANGFIISSGENMTVTNATTTQNIAVLKLDLYTVSGNITGLSASDLTKVGLDYTTTGKVYIPVPVINTTTGAYSVDLEANTPYIISATGVNDSEILANTITVTGVTTGDVGFTAKPTYPIAITPSGLDTNQKNSLTLTFTNFTESGYVYTFAPNAAINLRNGTYVITHSGLNASEVIMTLTSNLKVNNAAVARTLDFVAPAITTPLTYTATLYVGTDKTYKTINAALADVTRMTSRTTAQRVTVMIDPGNYEEMLVVTQPNITLKNAATSPNIALLNRGVDISANAVRITSYYGHGLAYYSMSADQKWHADVLAVNKANGYKSYSNAGAGTTNGSYWNATVVINANGFQADDIIFENSFNQYISKKESEDVLELLADNKGGVRPTTIGSTTVQNKSFVERAAAIAVLNNVDKVILNKCRVIGRQDSFYGGTGARVVAYKGVIMGGTDYIFGPMNAVFYQTDLAMNTSADSNDVSYITAAQQAGGRGYLMYECKITSAVPGTETASIDGSKPGYFGRPWAVNTSEVVFYNTTIENSTFPANLGQSLIVALGWNNSLSGNSTKMYEYGSKDPSGVAANTTTRATWATLLTTPTLPDTQPTPITTLNFTKGTDGWDPISSLIAADSSLGTKNHQATSSVNVYANKNNVIVSNVKSSTNILVYALNGALVKSFETNEDTNFDLNSGVWIVVVKATDGQKTVKIMTY